MSKEGIQITIGACLLELRMPENSETHLADIVRENRNQRISEAWLKLELDHGLLLYPISSILPVSA